MSPTTCAATMNADRGARVIKRTKLLYSRGPDKALDRPSHVRAGSALALLGTKPDDRRLAVVQDDACFIAIINPKNGHVHDIPFEGVNDLRQFDDIRGNKKSKLDLEACFALRRPDGSETLIALGSGSSPVRERFVVVENPRSESDASVKIIDVHALYAAMRADSTFSGSELNLEGALVRGEHVLFFQRGNGAPTASLSAVDATARIELAPLLRYLSDPSSSYKPTLSHVTQWDLGSPDGHRLTFTDGSITTERQSSIAFLACAEDSPDATQDGPVSAVAIGVLDDTDGTCELGLILDENGAPLLDKAEGLAFDLDDPTHAFVVTDRDDPTAPCELIELRLGSAWSLS